MTTFLRAFAIMLAFTGFSAANTYSSTPVTTGGSSHIRANDGTGMSGAPICTNSLPNCGLD